MDVQSYIWFKLIVSSLILGIFPIAKLAE